MNLKNRQEELKSLKSQNYWELLESQLKNDFGQECEIKNPIGFSIKLPSQNHIAIESSWYDILVLSKSSRNCIEIKYSKRNHAFGAFTIGEWILAYLSFHDASYNFQIYFIDEYKDQQFKIRKLNLTSKKLEFLLSSLQFKLYFGRRTIDNLFNENPIVKEKNGFISQKTLDPIIKEFKKSLYKFVEYSEY